MYNECTDDELIYMTRCKDERAIYLLIQRVEKMIDKIAESIIKKQGCYDVEDAW